MPLAYLPPTRPQPAPQPLTGHEPAMANAVAGILNLTAQAITAELDTGPLPTLLQRINWQPVNAAATLLHPHYVAAIRDEYTNTLLPYPQPVRKGTFDAIDASAVQWAETKSAALITNITADQRTTVQKIITESVTGNLTPTQAATQIRQTVGLTERQQQSVINRGNAANKHAYQTATAAGLTPAQAATQAAKAQAAAEAAQHQKMLTYRSKVIARTEIMHAQNEGRYKAWQTGVEEGYIDPKARKKWLTTTGRACPTCTPWHGTHVLWNEDFPNGVNMPPLHPQCRCTATIAKPGKTATGNLTRDGYETKTATIKTPTGTQPAKKAPKFTGTRCPICPGNCNLRRAIDTALKAHPTPLTKAAACPAMPKSAPPNAIPVSKASELDVGDIIWVDHLKYKCYEVLQVGTDKGPEWVKVKAPSGHVSTKWIESPKTGKMVTPHAVTPGPAKQAKQPTPSTTPPPPGKPPHAPKDAIPTQDVSDLDKGDTFYGEYKVGGNPIQGVILEHTDDYVYIQTPDDAYFVKFSTLKDTWAYKPGPNKAAHVLNQTGTGASPPHPMGQGAVRAPGVWHPAPGKLTGHADYQGNSYLIVEDKGNGKWLIQASSGKKFEVDRADLVGLPPGTSLKTPGGVKKVVSVSGDEVTVEGGQKYSLATLTENGTSAKATKTEVFKPTSGKPPPAAPQTPKAPTQPKPAPQTGPQGKPGDHLAPQWPAVDEQSWDGKGRAAKLPHELKPRPTPAKPKPIPGQRSTAPTPQPRISPTPGRLRQADGTDFDDPVMPHSQILGEQLSGPKGSNTHPPSGIWRGTDGVERYVKAYDNPEQAWSELLANRLYQSLGIDAPPTRISHYVYPDGSSRWLIVTDIVPNKGTVGSGRLTKKIASEITDGTAADMWLANFDSIGMGADNIVKTSRGLVRIDSGGSMFFRAQGAKKTSSVLDTVDFDALFSRNPDYARVLKAAGFNSPDELVKALGGQVADIRAVVDAAGGMKFLLDDLWDEIVRVAGKTGYPPPPKPSLAEYARLLERRLDELEKQAGVATVKPPPLAVAQPKQNAAPAPAAARLDAPEPPTDAGLPAKGGYGVEQAAHESDWGRPIYVAWDHDAVEDFTVGVAKGKWEGQAQAEYRLKLTTNYLEHLREKVDDGLDGWTSIDGYRLTGLDRATGEWSDDAVMFASHQGDVRTLRKVLPDGTRIDVVYEPPGGSEAVALRGLVRIYTPEGNVSTQHLQDVLSELLIPSKANRYQPGDAESLANLARMRTVQVFTSEADRRSPTFDVERRLTQIKKDWGIGPEDMSLDFDAFGRPMMVWSDDAVDKIIAKTGVKKFKHDVGGAGGLIGIIKERAMVPTLERWLNGVNVRGMSSHTDLKGGGGSYFFTRQRSRMEPAHGGMTLWMDARQMFRRTDFFAYNGDKYGRRIDGHFQVQGGNTMEEIRTTSGACETMWKGEIGLEEFVMQINMSTYQRDEILTLLQDGGAPQDYIDWFLKIVKTS